MKVKGVVFCFLVFFFLGLLGSTRAQPVPRDERVEGALKEARTLSAELAESVRGLLLQEVKKGGFDRAVEVCSEKAQEITRQFNSKAGHSIRRVSLRYRNPQNIPDDYERKKLEEMDRLNRDQRLAQEYVEVVRDEGGESLRYLKPLLVAPLCLTCHGPKENIPEEVKKILKGKYPEDRATGFLPGDLRGAISVKMKLPRNNER